MHRTLTLAASALCFAVASAAAAQSHQQSPTHGIASAIATTAQPYAPYAFLIGDWDVTAGPGGPAIARQSFRWGANHAYIWYAGSIMAGDKVAPHFEGILTWNGVRKNLDMLLEVDLNTGLAEERGTFSIAEGVVVRDIEAFYAEGVVPIGRGVVGPEGYQGKFRQTYRQTGSGQVETTVMRKTADGWTPTFPGSDKLTMTLRAAGP